jgi:hypothetical protein
MRGNPHVRFGPGAAGKGPAYAGTSPAAYRHPVGRQLRPGVHQGLHVLPVAGENLGERA